jgi:hypothetical protein
MIYVSLHNITGTTSMMIGVGKSKWEREHRGKGTSVGTGDTREMIPEEEDEVGKEKLFPGLGA